MVTEIFWFDGIISEMDKYQCICCHAILSPIIAFQNQPKYSSLPNIWKNRIQKGAILFESNYNTSWLQVEFSFYRY